MSMMMKTECQIINLPKISDPRGNLSIIEQIKQIPFEMKRVHWIYDVPGGMDRGGHAFKETEEFIVALSGSFDVEIDDGAFIGRLCQFLSLRSLYRQARRFIPHVGDGHEEEQYRKDKVWHRSHVEFRYASRFMSADGYQCVKLRVKN